ncbi:hypothetical protein Tco_0210656 [Tanacetum coccineum]
MRRELLSSLGCKTCFGGLLLCFLLNWVSGVVSLQEVFPVKHWLFKDEKCPQWLIHIIHPYIWRQFLQNGCRLLFKIVKPLRAKVSIAHLFLSGGMLGNFVLPLYSAKGIISIEDKTIADTKDGFREER